MLTAPFTVLGEAPGRTEDRLGKPFVGEAGVLLRKTLRHVGLDPDRATWCNVVSCWPSEAMTPQPEHIQACRSNLAGQLAVCESDHVLVCGRIAAQAMLPHATIKHSTGKLVEAHGKKLFIVRHPASFIRGRSKRVEFDEWKKQLEDFRALMVFSDVGEVYVGTCLYCEKDTYPSPYSLTCRRHGVTLQADTQWEQDSRPWWKTNKKNTRQSKATEERMI